VQKGIITREPAVDAVMRNELPAQSLRTAQRRFLRATGITHRAVQQIERARHATNLLRQGASILDTVYDAGYLRTNSQQPRRLGVGSWRLGVAVTSKE
jgi:methylphosphotriester-DNA--protein-cysteine methyltransferase